MIVQPEKQRTEGQMVKLKPVGLLHAENAKQCHGYKKVTQNYTQFKSCS